MEQKLAERQKRFTNQRLDNRYEELRAGRDALRKDYIRRGLLQDPNIRVRLSDAITFHGTCEDMCPEFERHEREYQNTLDRLEKIPGTEQVDHAKAVKCYHRPAAGDPPPMPSDVRPPLVLSKTLHYLFHEVLMSVEMEKCHAFLRDRTRSIRQDFTFQNERGDVAIDVHERIARYHILATHLQRETKGFSAQQEVEQLRKVLQSLREFYDDARRQGLAYPNEAEFRAYYILVFLDNPKMLVQTQALSPDVLRSGPVQLALLIHSLASPVQPDNITSSYGRPAAIFDILRLPSIPVLMACVVEIHFRWLRYQGLLRLNAGEGDAEPVPVPLANVIHMFGLNGPEEAEMLCEELTLQRRDDPKGQVVLLDKHSLRAPPKGDYRVQSILIHSKINRPILDYIEYPPPPPPLLPGMATPLGASHPSPSSHDLERPMGDQFGDSMQISVPPSPAKGGGFPFTSTAPLSFGSLSSNTSAFGGVSSGGFSLRSSSFSAPIPTGTSASGIFSSSGANSIGGQSLGISAFAGSALNASSSGISPSPVKPLQGASPFREISSSEAPKPPAFTFGSFGEDDYKDMPATSSMMGTKGPVTSNPFSLVSPSAKVASSSSSSISTKGASCLTDTLTSAPSNPFSLLPSVGTVPTDTQKSLGIKRVGDGSLKDSASFSLPHFGFNDSKTTPSSSSKETSSAGPMSLPPKKPSLSFNITPAPPTPALTNISPPRSIFPSGESSLTSESTAATLANTHDVGVGEGKKRKAFTSLAEEEERIAKEVERKMKEKEMAEEKKRKRKEMVDGLFLKTVPTIPPFLMEELIREVAIDTMAKWYRNRKILQSTFETLRRHRQILGEARAQREGLFQFIDSLGSRSHQSFWAKPSQADMFVQWNEETESVVRRDKGEVPRKEPRSKTTSLSREEEEERGREQAEEEAEAEMTWKPLNISKMFQALVRALPSNYQETGAGAGRVWRMVLSTGSEGALLDQWALRKLGMSPDEFPACPTGIPQAGVIRWINCAYRDQEGPSPSHLAIRPGIPGSAHLAICLLDFYTPDLSKEMYSKIQGERVREMYRAVWDSRSDVTCLVLYWPVKGAGPEGADSVIDMVQAIAGISISRKLSFISLDTPVNGLNELLEKTLLQALTSSGISYPICYLSDLISPLVKFYYSMVIPFIQEREKGGEEEMDRWTADLILEGWNDLVDGVIEVLSPCLTPQEAQILLGEGSKEKGYLPSLKLPMIKGELITLRCIRLLQGKIDDSGHDEARKRGGTWVLGGPWTLSSVLILWGEVAFERGLSRSTPEILPFRNVKYSSQVQSFSLQLTDRLEKAVEARRHRWEESGVEQVTEVTTSPFSPSHGHYTQRENLTLEEREKEKGHDAPEARDDKEKKGRGGKEENAMTELEQSIASTWTLLGRLG